MAVSILFLVLSPLPRLRTISDGEPRQAGG